MKKTTKTITIKLTDSDRQTLDLLRGERNISTFVRSLLFEQQVRSNRRLRHCSSSFADVALIRVKLAESTSGNALYPIDSFRALAIYLTEVVKLGNPPAYSNQHDMITSLFRRLVDSLAGVSQ
jgi:hypothetical protein